MVHRAESVTTAAFSYGDTTTPKGYSCGACGRTGVKLWREYQTFLNHQTLRCRTCAEHALSEDQRKQRDDMAAQGWKTDQIGWRVPAVPTEEGDTYWGYTSVPKRGADWWDRLPDVLTNEGQP